MTLLGGGLATWFFQTNGLLKPLEQQSALFQELRGCDLCSGFWVFLLLVTVDPKARIFALVAPVDIVLSAMVYTYAAHLLKTGFMTENGTTYLEAWTPDVPTP